MPTKTRLSNFYISPAMTHIFQTIELVSMSGIGVLIVGEQGTEKEWLAKIIHDLSSRKNNNFIMFDCNSVPAAELEKKIFGFEELTVSGVAINRGLLELAFGGTLFLENISSLSSDIQTKIGSVLKNKHYHRLNGVEELNVSFRIIGGTSEKDSNQLSFYSPKKEIHSSICPLSVNLPPLRERKEDLPFLVERMLRESNVAAIKAIKGFSKEALELLVKYNWPGNTKQLFSVVDHSISLCNDQLILVKHLPEYLRDLHISQPSSCNENIVESI